MIGKVEACTVALRRAYRRVLPMGVVAAAAGLGMLPILVAAPQSTGVPALGVLLLVGYLLRKAVLSVRTHGVVKQLRMEEHFVRINREAHELQRCVRTAEHLWERSVLVRVLRAVIAIPSTQFIVVEDKQRAVHRLCRRAFRRVSPPPHYVDLAGLLAVSAIPLWLMGSAPLLLALWTGFAFAVAVAAEGLRTTFQHRLYACFEDFASTVGAWTCTETLETAVDAARRRTYVHRPLYQDQPWFAGTPPAYYIRASEMPAAAAVNLSPSGAQGDGHWSLVTEPGAALPFGEAAPGS